MADPSSQRYYRAPCPGCGAPVEFRSAQSTHAVCAYCQSTVVRQGDTLARIGKMAELFDDFSPLQLFAASGTFNVAHFPNNADASADPGSPWLALAADSVGAVLTTGSDFALPAGAKLDASTRVHLRTNAYVFAHNGFLGYPVGKKIQLPKNWQRLLAEQQ